MSEAADAFLETINSIMTYQDRKKQIAKYGEPDSRWTTCPSLAPVVAATLPSAAIKDDKVAFRTQQMYMEAVAPLAAFLESTDDENFTIKEAIPMVQSAIKLLGDATQHHSAIRRKAIMQHLNPQLQTLMKDKDFKGAQPLLFREHLGRRLRQGWRKLQLSRRLCFHLNPSIWVFRRATLSDTQGATKVARPDTTALKEGVGRKDFTRKILTRTLDHVNTSCANFKYNRESYSIVNTGVCSKAPP